jgi:hypothetical protein
MIGERVADFAAPATSPGVGPSLAGTAL